METFVKLTRGRMSYLGFEAAEGVEGAIHFKHFCYDVKASKAMVKEGLTSTIEANQSFDLELGTIEPDKYSILVQVHPALQMAAQGVSSFVLEPEEALDLTLTFKALRKIDLTKLPYTVRMYVLG